MDYSIFLARLLGLYLVIVCAAVLLNRHNLRLIFHAFKNEEVPFFSGFVVLLVGLYLVLTHNIWSADYRGVITLIGWIGLIKGVVRLCMPQFVVDMTKELKRMPELISASLFIGLLLGIYLTAVGFTG